MYLLSTIYKTEAFIWFFSGYRVRMGASQGTLRPKSANEMKVMTTSNTLKKALRKYINAYNSLPVSARTTNSISKLVGSYEKEIGFAIADFVNASRRANKAATQAVIGTKPSVEAAVVVNDATRKLNALVRSVGTNYAKYPSNRNLKINRALNAARSGGPIHSNFFALVNLNRGMKNPVKNLDTFISSIQGNASKYPNSRNINMNRRVDASRPGGPKYDVFFKVVNDKRSMTQKLNDLNAYIQALQGNVSKYSRNNQANRTLNASRPGGPIHSNFFSKLNQARGQGFGQQNSARENS